mgnify:CR=1 FL=1
MAEQIKPTSTKKTTTKANASKTEKTKKTTVAKKPPVVKEEVVKKAPVKKKPKTTSTPKTTKQLKAEVVTKAAVAEVFEGKVQKEHKKVGKTFYLIFSLIFFTIAFFYINNVIYDNAEPLESALFAFAALFVVFVLLNFNVHMIIINFFRLPFKFLFAEAKLELNHGVIVDPEAKGFNAKLSKYKAIFTLILYGLILLLLMGSQIWNGIIDGDKILVIISQSLATGFVFLMIVCSWQYLFNIIPSVLENSIDAKNGFILTLSAIVMIIYVVFIIFDVTYLAELMIFILIIGFVALLGVNLNMIVGELNIFSNLKNRTTKNKSVTRAVFMIFFSFHLYIILYASVVAYSIYNWNPDTYNFINFEYEEVLVENVTSFTTPVNEVYDVNGVLIDTVYDKDGKEITKFKLEDGTYVKEFYDVNGIEITNFYIDTSGFNPISEVQDEDGEVYYPASSNWATHHFTYVDGTLVGLQVVELPHTYGDMLYYAVITISSIGYGDITPNSNYAMPQFWGGFLSIYGITFYALSIGYVSNIAGMGVTEKREED